MKKVLLGLGIVLTLGVGAQKTLDQDGIEKVDELESKKPEKPQTPMIPISTSVAAIIREEEF